MDSFSGFELNLDSLPEELLLSRIIEIANQGRESLPMPILPYERIAIPESDWGKGNSIPCISVPIGVGEDNSIFEVTLGRDNSSIHHGIIGGMTGSGKGNFLRVLITQLLCKYSPEELELYLLDFKQAQDLGNYQTNPTLHIRAVIDKYDPLSGLAILRWLVQEKETRSTIFRSDVKIEDYRKHGNKLPRILLILDEFPKLLSDPVYGSQALELLKDLAKEGRSYGIHLFLSTQTLENMADMRTSYGQMGLRVALKVKDPSQSEKILGQGNVTAAELNEIGMAIISQATHVNEDKDTKVKVAFIENEQQRDILIKLNKLFATTVRSQLSSPVA